MKGNEKSGGRCEQDRLAESTEHNKLPVHQSMEKTYLRNVDHRDKIALALGHLQRLPLGEGARDENFLAATLKRANRLKHFQSSHLILYTLTLPLKYCRQLLIIECADSLAGAVEVILFVLGGGRKGDKKLAL